jgi:4-aminobutyrate aminotransferase
MNLAARDSAVMAGVAKLRLFPLEVSAGDGCWLIEPGGRRLLDLKASASGLGHGHPAITEAILKAARNSPGAGSLSAALPDSVAFAEELLATVPGSGDRRVYLGHAGSDANEVAIRACRNSSGRRRVIAFEHSYHGGLGLARGVSGVHVANGGEADSAVSFIPYPGTPSGGDGMSGALAAAENSLAEGDVACLIVEPILSDGGVVVPPAGFLRALHVLCRCYGTLMTCDEVKVGLGRTGLLHAFEYDNVTPDLVTFGKSLGGGLPLAAAVGPGSVLDAPPASAILTTGGNPICAAAGRAALRVILKDGLAEAAARRGEQLRETLRQLATGHAIAGEHIADIRGRGLTSGIEVRAEGAAAARDFVRKACLRAWQLGAVVGYVGGRVLEITPPLTISSAEVELAAEILIRAIADTASGAVTDDDIRPFSGW